AACTAGGTTFCATALIRGSLSAAALSDPRINAVAQKVVPPAVHAAQTPITVPHTDITLPPLTQVIGR
ncbi:hypothetical protein, partial [Mycolicibacterium mageritense]|uniref:hypothetical protein n=1 Tax=Mycolicibacterium mageritense TaxID=53462 RepID=UPI0023F44A2E